MRFLAKTYSSSELSQAEVRKYNRIRDLVVNWYEKSCLQDEIESFDFDFSKKEDRLRLVTLGIFFNCIFQETKALRLFAEMDKAGYLKLDELGNFEANLKDVMESMERKTRKSWKILKIQNMIDSINALECIFSEEDDIVGLIQEKGIEGFIKYLYCELSGIKAKLMWICRECRGYFQIPEAYCYVPDSHVNKFLYNIGFINNLKIFSLEECMQISEGMSRVLCNKYFDLPYMRYHQKKCKPCEKGNNVKCEIQCTINRKRAERASIR